jgi:hypothetical protein
VDLYKSPPYHATLWTARRGKKTLEREVGSGENIAKLETQVKTSMAPD